MKKKRDKANGRKERTAALIAVNEMALHILKQVVDYDTGDLQQLVEQYANLSLAGSFSVRARSTVRFLEAMEKEFNDKDKNKLETVMEGLDHMRRALGLLNKIEGDVREEEEVCTECMTRDREIADVDVTSPGVWECESDAALYELIEREDEIEWGWYEEQITELAQTGHGLRPPERMSKGDRLTERNLEIWSTAVTGVRKDVFVLWTMQQQAAEMSAG